MAMALKMPEVQSCCWYISLRTGTKIFGFISLGCSLLLGVVVVMELPYWLHTNHEILVAERVLELVLQIIHLVASFLLLLGVYQENSKLIPPWLVTTILVAVSELFHIPTSLLCKLYIQYIVPPFTITSVLFIIVDLMDEIYGFLVVYSYYRTLSPMDANPV